jgi:hypothetical protein
MAPGAKKAKPGETVLLTELPPRLLRGLPRTDQRAISEIVGKPVLLIGYDDDGRAELEFTDRNGAIHSIYVHPSFLRPTT